MLTIGRFGLALALLAMAIVCYAIGFQSGMVVFLAIGCLCEIGFWIKLFPRKKRASNSPSSLAIKDK